MSIKPGTIGLKTKLYDKFMRADCITKHRLARKNQLNYVYTPGFDCDHFQASGYSSENLGLYKFIEQTED